MSYLETYQYMEHEAIFLCYIVFQCNGIIETSAAYFFQKTTGG